ncbi:DUF4339 domain-containing protein [Rhodopirellula sp. MGV]|uniref:DUF4339 domain-containing protein n=1 Tax=Rhodopirellula sp. MGV TaxID=2023130 RepID=UPI000B97A180|nr:DUF4339 domain-containing protein [Rhodopirellula sp. MGV]OYP34393.1 hypothetical protein CGZ80_15160 [Rhodopirellula sp. MGV]PNY37433.1 DUF4339 domain-containing protein [Rhodopirellula baltica]
MTQIDRVFIRFRGRTIGPLTPDKVKEMVRRGQVTRMHELSADGLSWTKAEEFGGFFPRVAPAGSAAGDLASDGNTVPPGSSGQAVIAPNENAAAQWYAHVQNEKQGPVSLDQMRLYVEAKILKKDSLVWKNGMQGWEPASEAIPELFGGKPASGSGASGDSAEDSDDVGGTVNGTLANELCQNHAWVLAFGIGLVLGCLVFFVVHVLKLSEGGQKPKSDTFSTVVHLISAAVGILVGGLAIQLATKLKAADQASSPIAAIVAAKSLTQFWQIGSIAAIAWTVIVTLVIIAAVAMKIPVTSILG